MHRLVVREGRKSGSRAPGSVWKPVHGLQLDRPGGAIESRDYGKQVRHTKGGLLLKGLSETSGVKVENGGDD